MNDSTDMKSKESQKPSDYKNDGNDRKHISHIFHLSHRRGYPIDRCESCNETRQLYKEFFKGLNHLYYSPLSPRPERRTGHRSL